MPRTKRPLKRDYSIPKVYDTVKATVGPSPIVEEDMLSLVDLRKQEEEEQAAYLTYEEATEGDDEIEIDLGEFEGLEAQMEDEFEVAPLEHQKGQYCVVITKDRPVRKQSFNSNGKEVPFEERNLPTPEYVELPIRDNVLAACERNEQKSKKIEDAQAAVDLHAEVRRIREEMKENKRLNELAQAADAGRRAAAETRRKMQARRMGIIS